MERTGGLTNVSSSHSNSFDVPYIKTKNYLSIVFILYFGADDGNESGDMPEWHIEWQLGSRYKKITRGG